MNNGTISSFIDNIASLMTRCVCPFTMLLIAIAKRMRERLIAFFIQENWWHQILSVTNKIFDLEAIKSFFNLNRDIWLRTIAGTLTIAAFNDIIYRFSSSSATNY